MGKSVADRLVTEMATAVLRLSAQICCSQRWRRLSRETSAALRGILDAVVTSVSCCEEGGEREHLMLAEVLDLLQLFEITLIFLSQQNIRRALQA